MLIVRQHSSAPAVDVSGKVFNVAAGRRVTLNETFESLKSLTGYKGQAAYGPERTGDVKHSLADISLAERHDELLYGLKPRGEDQP